MRFEIREKDGCQIGSEVTIYRDQTCQDIEEAKAKVKRAWTVEDDDGSFIPSFTPIHSPHIGAFEFKGMDGGSWALLVIHDHGEGGEDDAAE